MDHTKIFQGPDKFGTPEKKCGPKEDLYLKVFDNAQQMRDALNNKFGNIAKALAFFEVRNNNEVWLVSLLGEEIKVSMKTVNGKVGFNLTEFNSKKEFEKFMKDLEEINEVRV